MASTSSSSLCKGSGERPSGGALTLEFKRGLAWPGQASMAGVFLLHFCAQVLVDDVVPIGYAMHGNNVYVKRPVC